MGRREIGWGRDITEVKVRACREAVEELWITEFEPPRGYAVAAESHGAKYLTRHAFAPEGAGTQGAGTQGAGTQGAGTQGAGTRVVMTFGAEGQTFFAKLMGKLFFKAMAKSVCMELKKDMAELKQICEAG